MITLNAITHLRNLAPTDKAIIGDALQVVDASQDYLQGKETYAWLYAISQAIRPTSLLEIGVRYGYSALAFFKGSNTIQSYAGYDSQCYVSGSSEIAYKNLSQYIPDRECMHNVDTQRLRELPKGYDVIYVDGDHTYNGAKHDVNLAWETGARFIIVDDISYISDCKRAVDDICDMRKVKPLYISSFRGTYLIYTGFSSC